MSTMICNHGYGEASCKNAIHISEAVNGADAQVLAQRGEVVITGGIAGMHKPYTGPSKPLVQQAVCASWSHCGQETTNSHTPCLACHVWYDTKVFGVHRRHSSSPPSQPRDRACLQDQRSSSQERTTAFLLHQAFRIKDDIISSLQGSEGYQHGETSDRRLLKNHIQTITSIVKKLSQDIEVLERQIRARDGAAVETNFAIQSLNRKYTQGLGDLRGRMARCEASVAKLSGDISIIWRGAQKVDKEIYSLHSALRSCVDDFEKKAIQLLGKIETSNSDESLDLKTAQGDQHHELQLLDFKLTSTLSDVRDQIQAHRKWTEAQLTRTKEHQAQHWHQLLKTVKERLERAEKEVEEKLLLLSVKLEQMDEPQKYEKQLNEMKSDEKSLHARITRLERQVRRELEEIHNEYRTGFQSIQESLELLKQLQNTRLKLEKSKIQKDMSKME
ncbi:PREDICTED: protein FAM81B [Chlamydotis macqueenii]|nr:PREDICTED: protein FAM81B [Chlamydotis macqueenii]